MRSLDNTTLSPVAARIFAVLVACLCAAMAFALPTQAYAEESAAVPITSADYDDADANLGNVVLLIRFAGDTVGDNADGYNTVSAQAYQANGLNTTWKRFERSLNETDVNAYTKSSMHEFFTYASAGKTNLYNYLPQSMSDQTVRYITLSHEFSYYKNGSTYNDKDIIEEALEQFRKNFDFDSDLADKDNDGYADCVTFFLQMPPNANSSDFRSHQTSASGLTMESTVVGSKGSAKLDKLLMISAGPGSTVTTSIDAGVFCHEMQHALGARDYYREGSGGESTTGSSGAGSYPVGIWDIMASSDAKSTPLAITRKDCGWGQIPFETLSADGSSKSFTLTTWANAQTDTGKRQAIAFKAPGSSSEYFVVEYRVKPAASEYKVLWDKMIPASGVIIYRVNPKFYEQGNFKGDDYVYLFRKGETGLKDSYSNGAKVPANLNTGESFGSTDMSATITDGALVYSDGSNSGLKITVTAESATEATFSIESPDYQSLRYWDAVTDKDGSTPFDSKSVSSTLTATDGTNIFLMTQEEGSQAVATYQWNGSAWSTLPALNESLSQPSIACAQGAVYLAGYSNSSGTAKAFKWTPGSSSWIALGSAGDDPISECEAFAIKDKLYLASSTESEVQVYALSGTSFAPVGNTITRKSSKSYLTSPTVFDNGSTVGLTVSDMAGSASNTTIYTLDSSSWKAVQTVGFLAGAISSARINDTSYVMLATNNEGTAPVLYRCPGTAEGTQETGETLTLSSLANVSSPGNLVACSHSLLFTTTQDNKLIVMQASLDNLHEWTKVGQAVLSPATSGSLTGIGSTAYCAGATSDGMRASLKSTTLSDTIVDPGGSGGSGGTGGSDSSGSTATELPRQTVTTAKSTYQLTYGKSASLGAKAKTALSYRSSNTKIATVTAAGKITAKGTGTCKITVTAKAGAYAAASKTVTVKVNPKGVALSKLKAGKKSFKASWKRATSACAGGYQVRYATAKSMKRAKKTTVKGYKATKKTVKKLKAGKKYYVQVRVYKKVAGKTYYSSWSAKKTVRAR